MAEEIVIKHHAHSIYMKQLLDFLSAVKSAIDARNFIKITLSKPTPAAKSLENIYVRVVAIKGIENLSFTYRFHTNDQTKNFDVAEGIKELQSLLDGSFCNARLFTQREDIVLQASKKGAVTLLHTKPSIAETPSLAHDREKTKRAPPGDSYLKTLGIMDAAGNLVPKMADKYKQINKYLEIVDSLLESTTLPSTVNIVDMGSGKGYLTFALYDYLKNKRGLDVTVKGIELRKELVDQCNALAASCGFKNLEFVSEAIDKFDGAKIDILIALHACDTATDDAIAKGIAADASLIVCAPCCHKQIRQQVKGKEQDSPIMKYGIFKERQFEMVTDTIRALILEKKRYQTKIFEFISNEHTRKNVMLVGTKTDRAIDEGVVDKKINSIKEAYQIDYHYLEKIVS